MHRSQCFTLWVTQPASTATIFTLNNNDAIQAVGFQSLNSQKISYLLWIVQPVIIIFNINWRRKWQPTPVFLPRKSHGWRSLVQATVHGVAKSRTRLSDFISPCFWWTLRELSIGCLFWYQVTSANTLLIFTTYCIYLPGRTNFARNDNLLIVGKFIW